MAIEVADARADPDARRGRGRRRPPPACPSSPSPRTAPRASSRSTAPPPTELVVQPLITGTGPAVESGQNVTFQYSGWLWDGTPFDSSWENGSPFTTTIGAGQVIQGWDQGLVGQPVGSQVLLVIPPALGYGDTEQGAIPAGSTLVFVVDILDAS